MQEETMLNLRWDSFSSQLTNSLDACYEKQCFVDLSLVCKNGTVLKCHKMVLSNASSFFRRLLVKNEHPHPMIILHDIEADDLKTIVNFMYCGEIQVLNSEVRRILKIAETLEVSGLKDIRSTITLPEDDEVRRKNLKKFAYPENSLKITEAKFNREDASFEAKNNADAGAANSIASRLRKKTNAPVAMTRIVSKRDERGSEPRFGNNPKSRCDFGGRNASSGYDDNVAATSRDANEYSNVRDASAKLRKRNNERVSWDTVLSDICKEDHTSLKRLCLMEEVEITATGTTMESPMNDGEPPGDEEGARFPMNSESFTDFGFYFKDEIDISYDLECQLNNAADKHETQEWEPMVDQPIEIFKRIRRSDGSVSTSAKQISLCEAKIKGKGYSG